MKISPEGISTEFLFSDLEIITEIKSKRLYIGLEFDERSLRHKTVQHINIGNGSANINKAGKKIIVEHGVFNLSNENIALSKENFAKAVFKNEISISPESWENFRHIFEFLVSKIQILQAKS